MNPALHIRDRRRSPYPHAGRALDHKFTTGDRVYCKRVGIVGGFNGFIVEPKGNGFQVHDPKTGKTYQRDKCDLILLEGEGVGCT